MSGPIGLTLVDAPCSMCSPMFIVFVNTIIDHSLFPLIVYYNFETLSFLSNSNLCLNFILKIQLPVLMNKTYNFDRFVNACKCKSGWKNLLNEN